MIFAGDAGSGKTALCQELSQPGQGPQARQQRALNRRLLARYFVQVILQCKHIQVIIKHTYKLLHSECLNEPIV